MNLSFLFGALCPKFSEQLKDQGYDLKNKEKWDKAVFSVVYLHIHDILTDSRYDECLNRIMKKSKVDWIKSEVRKMNFIEIFDIQSNVRVCDIIHLFLIGGDDKIYFNLSTPNNKGYCDDYILKCERIISKSWAPYYECNIKWIEEECSGESGVGYLTLII